LAAQRVTVEAGPSLFILSGSSMSAGQVGGGLALTIAAGERVQFVLGGDLFDKTDPQVCPVLPDTPCDLRFTRTAATLSLRFLLTTASTLTPYVGAGGYLTSWDGSYGGPLEAIRPVSGSGPSGVAVAAGLRFSGATTSHWSGGLEYQALFDVEGGTGGIVRATIGSSP
jgi:hypothetical protein